MISDKQAVGALLLLVGLLILFTTDFLIVFASHRRAQARDDTPSEKQTKKRRSALQNDDLSETIRDVLAEGRKHCCKLSENQRRQVGDND